MNTKPLLLQLALITSLGLHFSCKAQSINQPKSHLPNDIANKVTQVRLKTLVIEEEVRNKVDGQLKNFSIRGLERGGCDLNLGNTIASGSSVETEVVIVGDVVNYCR